MMADLVENFSIDAMIHDRGDYYRLHVGNSDRMVDCSVVDSFLVNDYRCFDCIGYFCYLDDNYCDSNCFRSRHHADVDWISMVQRLVAVYLVWLKI